MWPAIIGAVGSLAGAALNAHNSSQAADTAYGRQKELMALQQQYAVENWNREVNYNDPKEQMKRLQGAGLNPNLVYGNGAAGLEAPATASPTAPSAPMQATAPGDFGATVSDAVQAAVGISQAKKAGSETIAQNIANEYLDRRNQLELEQLLQNIGVSSSQRKKLDKEVMSIDASIREIESRIGLNDEQKKAIKASIQKMGTDQFVSLWNSTLAAKQLDGQLKRWAAENAVSYAQANQISQLTPYMVTQMIIGNGIQGIEYMLKDLKLNPEKAVKFASNYVGTLVDAVESAVEESSFGKWFQQHINGDYFDFIYK